MAPKPTQRSVRAVSDRAKLGSMKVSAHRRTRTRSKAPFGAALALVAIARTAKDVPATVVARFAPRSGRKGARMASERAAMASADGSRRASLVLKFVSTRAMEIARPGHRRGTETTERTGPVRWQVLQKKTEAKGCLLGLASMEALDVGAVAEGQPNAFPRGGQVGCSGPRVVQPPTTLGHGHGTWCAHATHVPALFAGGQDRILTALPSRQPIPRNGQPDAATPLVTHALVEHQKLLLCWIVNHLWTSCSARIKRASITTLKHGPHLLPLHAVPGPGQPHHELSLFRIKGMVVHAQVLLRQWDHLRRSNAQLVEFRRLARVEQSPAVVACFDACPIHSVLAQRQTRSCAQPFDGFGCFPACFQSNVQQGLRRLDGFEVSTGVEHPVHPSGTSQRSTGEDLYVTQGHMSRVEDPPVFAVLAEHLSDRHFRFLFFFGRYLRQRIAASAAPLDPIGGGGQSRGACTGVDGVHCRIQLLSLRFASALEAAHHRLANTCAIPRACFADTDQQAFRRQGRSVLHASFDGPSPPSQLPTHRRGLQAYNCPRLGAAGRARRTHLGRTLSSFTLSAAFLPSKPSFFRAKSFQMDPEGIRTDPPGSFGSFRDAWRCASRAMARRNGRERPRRRIGTDLIRGREISNRNRPEGLKGEASDPTRPSWRSEREEAGRNRSHPRTTPGTAPV
eukprot:scaffold41_cov370-Pavlova_lutheri.AAC.6